MPAGAALRASIWRDSTPVWFRPAALSSLPAPWADLLASWFDAFGIHGNRHCVRVMTMSKGFAIALPGPGHFRLAEGLPGLAAEIDLMARHLDDLAARRRRQAMIGPVAHDRPPPAWSFTAPALTGAILADRGVSPDELVAGLFRWGRGWNRGSGRTRSTKFLERLELRACVEGERLKLDARLGAGVWFRDIGRGRLEVDAPLPATVLDALAGRQAAEVVGHPALEAADAPIRKAFDRKGRALVDIDMPLAPLAPEPPACIGWPGTVASGAPPRAPARPWHSDGVLRDRLAAEARALLGAE